MSFQISPELDKNKVFLLRSSELEGRLDPHFYKPEFIENEELLQKIGCSKLLQHSISIFSGITPVSGGDAYCNKENGIPFIRSGDFVEDGEINFDELLYIKPEIHNGPMKGSKLKKDDLLVAIVGATIGKVGIYKDGREANINQAIAAVRLDSSLIPEYARAFLLTSLGQKVIDRIKRPVARANINLEEVGRLTIPNLSIYKQNKIVKVVDTAYSSKREKEAEAQRWLDSIDAYLLGELGIELPEQKENTVQSRIFIRRFSEISGGRIDPNFIFLSKILSGKFTDTALKLVSFGNCIKYIQYGISSLANKEGKGIPIIRMNNLRNYEWDFSDIKHIDLSNDELEKYRLFYGDILFNRTNSKELVGKCGVFKESQHYVFASYLIRVRLDESVLLPDFASSFLGSTLGRLQIDCISRQIIGMTNINAEEIKLIKILVPSLQKQAEIVDHIAQIRSRAKQLQQEAKEGLEQAKRAVEAMILGDA